MQTSPSTATATAYPDPIAGVPASGLDEHQQLGGHDDEIWVISGRRVQVSANRLRELELVQTPTPNEPRARPALLSRPTRGADELSLMPLRCASRCDAGELPLCDAGELPLMLHLRRDGNSGGWRVCRPTQTAMLF